MMDLLMKPVCPHYVQIVNTILASPHMCFYGSFCKQDSITEPRDLIVNVTRNKNTGNASATLPCLKTKMKTQMVKVGEIK